MKPQQALLYFSLRFVPALVFSLASSLILTLPFFQKSIADDRIGKLQQEINEAQHYIDAHWRKAYHADLSVNTNVKNTLDAKRGIIADNTEEIRKIRQEPLQSRELAFIQQMETVLEGAMTNRIELFLHLFFWLVFFTVEMVPLLMFYLDRNSDSYTAGVSELEGWRMTKAFEEITRQNKNEILAKQVESIETVYENKKKLHEYEIKIRELELEQRKTLHRIDQELQRLEPEQPPSTPTEIRPPDPPLDRHPPSESHEPPVATSTPPTAHEDPQPAPDSMAADPHRAKPDNPAVPNGLAADSKEADFLKRLNRLTDDD